MTTWFTADLHFGHQNIIRYCNRPFDDVDEMNSALIRNWNDTVSEGDTVWIVGDFALGKIAETLPLAGDLRGHKILVGGNHDRCWHGHVHERWACNGRMVNVGVDVTGFRPVSLDEVAAVIRNGPRSNEAVMTVWFQ